MSRSRKLVRASDVKGLDAHHLGLSMAKASVHGEGVLTCSSYSSCSSAQIRIRINEIFISEYNWLALAIMVAPPHRGTCKVMSSNISYQQVEC